MLPAGQLANPSDAAREGAQVRCQRQDANTVRYDRMPEAVDTGHRHTRSVSTHSRYSPGMADPHATAPERDPDRSAPQKTVPYLELTLECERPLAGPARYCLSAVERVRLGRGVERDVRLASDGCLDIVVPDAWMSLRHAELAGSAGSWALTDLHSRNGTRLNGARMPGGAAARVAEGDLLRLGHTFFRFFIGRQENGPPFREAGDIDGPVGSWSP